jgi:D-xylose transport system substrate-binding protein
VTDTQTKTVVSSVLLTPKWVTPSNMASTVIADQFVSAKQLCAGSFASDCSANSITP